MTFEDNEGNVIPMQMPNTQSLFGIGWPQNRFIHPAIPTTDSGWLDEHGNPVYVDIETGTVFTLSAKSTPGHQVYQPAPGYESAYIQGVLRSGTLHDLEQYVRIYTEAKAPNILIFAPVKDSVKAGGSIPVLAWDAAKGYLQILQADYEATTGALSLLNGQTPAGHNAVLGALPDTVQTLIEAGSNKKPDPKALAQAIGKALAQFRKNYASKANQPNPAMDIPGLGRPVDHPTVPYPGNYEHDYNGLGIQPGTGYRSLTPREIGEIQQGNPIDPNSTPQNEPRPTPNAPTAASDNTTAAATPDTAPHPDIPSKPTGATTPDSTSSAPHPPDPAAPAQQSAPQDNSPSPPDQIDPIGQQQDLLNTDYNPLEGPTPFSSQFLNPTGIGPRTDNTTSTAGTTLADATMAGPDSSGTAGDFSGGTGIDGGGGGGPFTAADEA